MKIYLNPFLFFSVLSLPLLAQGNNKIIFPKSKNKIIVIAHRGDHTIAPENSLLAIENAIIDGADYVELDLRTSKDGQLVLMHDVTLDRMTNGHGKIQELSFDTIRALKLYNKNISNSDTVQVPSFEEALKACKNRINIYLDFKEANVQQAYAAIQKANMGNQMVVYINAPNQYMDWRKWVPQMPLILSLNTKIKDSLAMIKYLDRIKIDILDGNWNEYTKETVQAALNKGVPVWADMQSKLEDETYWRKSLSLGLAGIQTDHPRELVQLIKRITQAGGLIR
jgi:glycerophosphoryl diester phosphodiesterase